MSKYEIVESEVQPFTKGSAMSHPKDDMTINNMVLAYKLVDFVEKEAAERKKVLRKQILSYAEVEGEPTEKGGSSVQVNGFKVVRERRRAADPNPEGIKELLEKNGIDVEEAFDAVKVLQLSPTKIKYLIESGKLDKEKVEALHAITFALRVFEPKELKPLLAESKAAK